MIREIIDYNIREQIRHELSVLTGQEKDLYDVKERYYELYELMEREYLDDVYGEISEDNRELCSASYKQEEFDQELCEEYEDIFAKNYYKEII